MSRPTSESARTETRSIDSRRYAGPLLTQQVHAQLLEARDAGHAQIECSLDLNRTRTQVTLEADAWTWSGQRFTYLSRCKDRTIYYWDGTEFAPVSRYAHSLFKLVPTEWGPPTFEIDGIKMLPTSRESPYEDARQKVTFVAPRGRRVLDTCGGLGYFAACCLESDAAHVHSLEKNPDVFWLRSINPWSPADDPRLSLEQADAAERIKSIPSGAFDAALHDPPRFGIAGELYSQVFYDELARVLKRKGKLFHYTGTPNKLTSGRDVPNEVATRLRRAGFVTELTRDGVLAVKR